MYVFYAILPNWLGSWEYFWGSKYEDYLVLKTKSRILTSNSHFSKSISQTSLRKKYTLFSSIAEWIPCSI